MGVAYRDINCYVNRNENGTNFFFAASCSFCGGLKRGVVIEWKILR